MQYVYLIKSDKFYKIGIANDPRSRLAQLQTGNPYELTIDSCFGFENAEIVERSLHQAFSGQNVRNEWFLLTPELISKFDSICRLLGGKPEPFEECPVRIDEIEEAEESSEYLPTIDDVKRIINDKNYRLEYRYGDNGLRGFAWRLRSGNKQSPLYIGSRNPIFQQVKEIIDKTQV